MGLFYAFYVCIGDKHNSGHKDLAFFYIINASHNTLKSSQPVLKHLDQNVKRDGESSSMGILGLCRIHW